MNLIMLYIRNHHTNILLQCLLVILGSGLFLLERYRHADLIDLASMGYYIILAFVIIVSWHTYHFMKVRRYLQEILEALHNEEALESAYLITGQQTAEQELFFELLLKQQKLYQSQLQKLERKRQIQYHFVLQWVHQMKTPVSVLDMQLQQNESNLKQRMLLTTQQQLELYRSMAEETEKLNAGLELMLGSARLDHFELDLHIKTIEIHTCIRELINRYKKQWIQYAIFPKLSGEALATTDGKWFSFIVNQILSNAMKYSKLKQGNKSLTIAISSIDDEVSVSISDEGIGIPPEDLRRIFDPFFTGKNGRLTGEATGMGLYLAKEVTERLGHTLQVQSTVNVGTTFTITIKQQGIHLFEH